MFNPKTTDLAECKAPEHVAVVLRNAATKFAMSAGELEAAWQDKNAGKIWMRFAHRLESLAAQFDKIVD